MSSTQDVRYSAEKVEQGQALANKLFNASRFVLLTVGEAGRRRAGGRERSRTAGSCRGCSARSADPPRESRASTSPRPRSASTTSSTASCATGTSRWSRPASPTPTLGHAAARAARDAGARPSGDPVRHRGAVVARPGAEGLLAAGPLPEARRRAARRGRRARDRGAIAAVGALRSFRNEAGVQPGRGSRAPGRRRLRADRARSSPGWPA